MWLLEDPLEEGMAAHSSILAWKIPWTEEPGRLQSMGLQRAGHYWAPSTLGFPGGLVGEESAYSAGDHLQYRDLGSVSGLGMILEKKVAAHLCLLAWEIPWTEEPGRP